MKCVFPPSHEPLDQSWLEPLEAVGRVLQGSWSEPFFDTGDFMIMCKLTRGPRPTLVLYKHVYTRRYLNLDDSGRTYRYCAPISNSTRSGRYLAHRDLQTAVEDLQLWELPWMKPGLEEYRRNLSWDERWTLISEIGELRVDQGGINRGHLHVV
jgi:hypothetical protein